MSHVSRPTTPTNPLHRPVQPMAIVHIVEGQAHEDLPGKGAGRLQRQKVAPPAVECHHHENLPIGTGFASPVRTI
ncbi:MAG: hypothetical protein ACE5F6_08665 [Anaerolineae bacterium]